MIVLKIYRWNENKKIHHRSLTENKISKYLIYAIDYIILMVNEILIALSINSWNENNKLEKETYKVLL
ncbi:hypothetical protein [Psychroflexus torquis]|uniref:hypothetical protein n=1 Tax=Psychroflexus torquis TaxID=57029 RepID=UPI0002FBBB4B|nr:hypothetical protein [Psychroflexus torquis]